MHCVGCDRSFKTEQGRGSHEKTCALAQLKNKEREEDSIKDSATISEALASSSTSLTIMHPPQKKTRAGENQDKKTHKDGTTLFTHQLHL